MHEKNRVSEKKDNSTVCRAMYQDEQEHTISETTPSPWRKCCMIDVIR
jgi:hypothetical protein